MSKRHDIKYKPQKLKRMLQALCKICNLRFIDDKFETAIYYYKTYVDETNYAGFSIIRNDIPNITLRYKTMFSQILVEKNGFWKNFLLNVPEYSSIEELELKLSIRGLL